jgi:hypothetical protein
MMLFAGTVPQPTGRWLPSQTLASHQQTHSLIFSSWQPQTTSQVCVFACALGCALHALILPTTALHFVLICLMTVYMMRARVLDRRGALCPVSRWVH